MLLKQWIGPVTNVKRNEVVKSVILLHLLISVYEEVWKLYYMEHSFFGWINKMKPDVKWRNREAVS